MGNDMFNDEQLAHAEIVQKETEDALGWWKERALKAEAALAALSRARETDGAVREAAERLGRELSMQIATTPVHVVAAVQALLDAAKGGPDAS